MQADIPQLYFDVDRDRAKMLGIPVSDIFSTMKAFLLYSIYVNDFSMAVAITVGIVFVPFFYVAVDRISARLRRKSSTKTILTLK